MSTYFNLRINVSIHRPNVMKAFTCMLLAPNFLFRDFISLMRLELLCGGPLQNIKTQYPNAKWTFQLSLTVHPRAGFAPGGMTSVIIKPEKVSLCCLHN